MATIGAALVVAIVLLLAAPMINIAVLGPTWFEGAVPTYPETRDKLRIAEIARSFALPPDSTITPIDAGRAFFDLQHLGESLPYPTAFPRPSVTVDYEQGWFPPNGPEELQGSSLTDLIERAANGLTADETAYLEHIAVNPAWEAFGTVARAPSVDFVGGQFVLPFPDTVMYWAMPLPELVASRDAAYASLGKAGYMLTQGRLEEAEETLRETISFGFALIDFGPSLTEVMIGTFMVDIGREALEHFYDATGRPEASILSARYDSVTATGLEDLTPSPDAAFGDRASVREELLRIATDTSLVMGFRTEGLVLLSLAPCSNARELLFGPDSDIQDAYEKAEREFVRFDSDRELMQILRPSPKLWAGAEDPDGALLAFVYSVARVSGWILGNDHMLACTAQVLQRASVM